MNLFEISQDFRDVFDQLALLMEEEDTPERNEMLSAAWDTIDGIEGMMNQKIENAVMYLRELEADADAITAESKRLSERAKIKENAAKNLKAYILTAMQRTDTKTIETARCKVTVKLNPEAVTFESKENEAVFRDWAMSNERTDLLTVSEPTVNRTAVKKALQSGEDLPFAQLTRSKSIMIK